MLKEVSQTVLIIFFLESSDVCCEVELSPVCRLVIMTDVICQSVLKLANPYLRVVRQCLGLLSGGCEHSENR